MTDDLRSAKARYIRFLVWYFLMALALVLMLPWEAWFGRQLCPFAFSRVRGEFHAQPVDISLSDRATLHPVQVHVNMTEGVCRVATDGTVRFSMGKGSAAVKSAGVATLALDPGAGTGAYELYLANQWYRRVFLSRWIVACVMLFVLASAGIGFVVRCEREMRGGYAATDARQQPVSVLDPIRMFLLWQRNPIPTELLAAVPRELVPGLRRAWRLQFWVLLLMMSGGFSIGLLYMRFSAAPLHEYLYLLPGLALYLIALASIWYGFRMRRLEHVKDVLLRHLRCPHCGYDLRMLPVDTADGATICPECGHAWHLSDTSDSNVTNSSPRP